MSEFTQRTARARVDAARDARYRDLAAADGVPAFEDAGVWGRRRPSGASTAEAVTIAGSAGLCTVAVAERWYADAVTSLGAARTQLTALLVAEIAPTVSTAYPSATRVRATRDGRLDAVQQEYDVSASGAVERTFIYYTLARRGSTFRALANAVEGPLTRLVEVAADPGRRVYFDLTECA
jgi:hypothetical protein